MIIIKKYRNRRFYNSSHSCYIRLPEIQKLVQNGEEIQVLAHPGGEDLTKQFLLEMALEKTKLLDSFTNSWLENLVQVAGTQEEEKILLGLSQFLSGEVYFEKFEEAEVENSDEEQIESEGEDKTEIVEFVEELSKGIPIKLEPEDLLELAWEEHSETEEVVEDARVSFQGWEDKTVERIEWSSENTVEKIEDIPDEPESESKEIVVNSIEESMEPVKIEVNEEAEEKEASRLEQEISLEPESESEETPEEESSAEKEERAEKPEEEIISAPEPSKEEPVEEKALSQKEILQAKLAALKAKLGQS